MKLIPASSAAWMMRTDSPWSVLPHSPNIIAPRQRGLTLTPVLPSSRSCMAPHLVDRREAGLEAVARRAQIEPPHAHSLFAGQADRLVDVLVQAPGPVAERLRVILAESLDVLGLEPGTLESKDDPRHGQRLAVGEHVALRERSCRRVGVTKARDAVVQ